MADVFVLIDNDVALAGLDGKGCNFVSELAGLLCGFSFVLGRYGKCVLHIARNFPLVGDVFSRLTHMVAVECIPQTIADHRVDVFHVAHFMASPQVGCVRRQCHVFLPTSGNNRRITQLDVLRTKCNST